MQTDNATHTDDLEQLFNEECKCQSKHIGTAVKECSIVATHRIKAACDDIPFLNICQNLAMANMYGMQIGRKCVDCGRRAADCWTIIPI